LATAASFARRRRSPNPSPARTPCGGVEVSDPFVEPREGELALGSGLRGRLGERLDGVVRLALHQLLVGLGDGLVELGLGSGGGGEEGHDGE
jgi:hypothetical protein